MAEGFLLANSPYGEGFQVEVPAESKTVLHKDRKITSCLIYTASSGVYLNIGSPATSSSFLMPPNTIIPISVTNLKLVSIYNSLGTSATIYVLARWR